MVIGLAIIARGDAVGRTRRISRDLLLLRLQRFLFQLFLLSAGAAGLPAALFRVLDVLIDLLKFSGELDGHSAERYCVNMFNIGFDSNVADLTARLKRYPLLSGSLAYLAAVVGMLVKKKGASLRIELDGEEVYAGPLLLTALANGCYCGGGIKSSPRALPDDGIMDVNIIYDVSRREFVSKFPAYTRGTHLELKDIDRLLYFSQCSRAKITPLYGSMRLCVDGEIMDAGPISIEVVPRALRFLLPPGKE